MQPTRRAALKVISNELRGFQPAYGPQTLSVTYQIRNNTNRQVNGFKGVIAFKDKFGDVVCRNHISRMLIVMPRDTIKTSVRLGYTNELPSIFRKAPWNALTANCEKLQVIC